MDGYNVLHAWPDQKTIWRGGIAVARERLGELVRVIHDREEVRTTLVFDGQGTDIEIERPGEHLTFSFLYTPKGITADTLIEQLVATAKSPASVWVVSRDNGIRETVTASGGTCIDPEDLFQWVHGSREQQGRDLKKHNSKQQKDWGQKLFPSGS